MFATATAAVGRRLTYANVASTLALVVALGTGTAYAANTVRSSNIVNGQVKTPDLANGAVGIAKMKVGSVGGDAIADGSIDSPDLGTNSVQADKIATDAVGASEIADSTIDSGEIVNDSLLSGDLASGSVGTSELADGAISGADIASSTITGADVSNNSLTTADLAGADVNGGQISIPSGYVPNGRCRQVDSSIGGATAGEAVLFSTQAAIQDGIVIYGQRVPSDGHVTFSVCNLSGTTQSAISNLAVRVITFG